MSRTSRPAALLASTLLLCLVAAPAVNASDLTGGITNVVPTLTSVTLGASSLTPTAGTTTSLLVTAVVADLNGYNDVSGVTVAILKPDGSTVHLAASSASFQSGSGVSATYTKTVTMNYHDAAALSTDTYKIKVVATDSQAAVVDNVLSLATFNYAELAALNAPASVSTGAAVQPGATSAVGTMSIGNYGNVQIDVQVSGTAPANGGTTIPIGSVAYSLNADMSSSAALTGSAASLGGFNLAGGSGSSKDMYWQITMPAGSSQYVPAGTYTGTVTVTAVAG